MECKTIIFYISLAYLKI